MDWIVDNTEWIFSGIGVFIIGLFITYIIRNNEPKQYQKSGKNSINIQSGKNVRISAKDYEKED